MVVMSTGCLLHLTVSVHYLGTLFRGMLLAAPDLHGPHRPHLDLRHLLHAMTTTGSSCPFPVPSWFWDQPHCALLRPGG